MLNAQSYAYHYRNIDSVQTCAQRAYDLAEGYDAGRAEALNNLAFVRIVRMAYDDAEKLLNEIPELTDNQFELLVCYVQQMRLCQRRSRNKDFYDYRERAIRCIDRIHEERASLTERQQQRLLYAETEYAIVNSTYYYYVGLERQSIEALRAINPDEVQRDTAQYLNYLYNIGAGGILTEGTQQEINQREFDHLMRCFLTSRQAGYPYFAANALEALSEHLMEREARSQLMADNLPAAKFINPDGVDDEMLAGWLAENSLWLFSDYGDVYQTAGAYRTLASCYRQIGDYESALYNLEQALSDSAIYQAPDLVASIREQLSVAYAAINDKASSDENRNTYIDLMTDTRQDRELEARASQYERSVTQLNWMLGAVVGAILLLLFLLWLFNHLNRRQKRDAELEALLEERQDEVAMSRLRLEDNERRNLEQRAKISLVNTITPLIDRMLYATRHLGQAQQQENLSYIRELTDQINDYNEILTHWIQLRKGELNLKIETFPLQQLFDILAKGRRSFEMKGIRLDVEPTQAQVKADRVLTLFMLNTLADNARKFTPADGQVVVSASETDRYVEIAVSDTGAGMTPEQLAHLFDAKPIIDDDGVATRKPAGTQTSHGFGLLNCKGIIEKYRKISQIFDVCAISAESRVGQGSRLWFRLPKGVARLLLCVVMASGSLMPCSALDPSSPDRGSGGAEEQGSENTSAAESNLAPPSSRTPAPSSSAPSYDDLTRAANYADSAYFSNIDGTYGRTLMFADSCIHFLNRHYLKLQPEGRHILLRQGNLSLTAPEIEWLHDSLRVNYDIILNIRNESAIAALALHEWQLYAYNNKIYTQLYKELSADNTLADYCRTMQQSQTNKRIAVILLLLMLVSIPPAYYLLYYRHRLYQRFYVEREQRSTLEMMDDELRRIELETSRLHVSNAVLDNCLSTLKHETMYYPSRIRQLVDQGDDRSLAEVTAYYRELYGILSSQAMSQVEGIQFHIRPIAADSVGKTAGRHAAKDAEGSFSILGDEHLIRYLFALLRKQGGAEPVCRRKDDKYVEVTVPMPSLHLSDEEAHDLFNASIAHIPWLLCRQIVRDHGEATNRRLCGIWAENEGGHTQVRIILPGAVKN